MQAQYPPRLEIAWAEHRSLTFHDLIQSLREPLKPDDTLNAPSGHIYTFVPYLPSAFGMFIARHSGGSALALLYSGRFFNLLVYTWLIYLALLQLPAFHLPLLLVASMPMSIQQAASLSADSLTISVTLLYFAVVLSLCCDDKDRLLTVRQYGVVLLLAVIVIMAKANVALLLLPVLIPASRFGGGKRKLALIACYLVAAYLPFAAWQYVNRDNLEAFRNASLRAGVDIPGNIAVLKSNPLGFLSVLWRTCREHWEDYLSTLVGNVGWNAARLPSWILWLYLAVLAVVSLSERGNALLTARQRWILAGIFVMSLLSIFVALWSLETQQRYTQPALMASSTTIANVQGRYFITILAMAVVGVATRVKWSIGWRVSEVLSTGVVMLAGAAFCVASWQAYYTDPSHGNVKPGGNIASLSNAGIFWGGFYLLQVEDSYSEGCRSFHFLSSHLETIPLLGDWNGDGRTKVGMYHKGVFYLDYNGNGRFDPDDKVYHFVPRQTGDVPVVGDWNGDGRTKIGIFRAGFLWILDHNGDGKLDPAPSSGGDRVFGLGGIPMDLPVVGDWNGDGRSKAGIYRHGAWLLQSEDSLTSNVTYITQRFASNLVEEGRDCDIPVVGDWNGDHKAKIGMLLVHNKGAGARTYQWILDKNGNGMFDGPGMNNDAVFDLGGAPGDVPLVWSQGRGNGTSVGLYRRGEWMVQQGSSVKTWHFGGLPQDVVLAGDWTGDGNSKAGVLRGGASWVFDRAPGPESTFSFGNFDGK